MKTSLFLENRLILIGGSMTAFTSIANSLCPSKEQKVFSTLNELNTIAGNEWYRCLKVGCVRNPYDLAVSLHFWYQQSIDPKSMTLATSVRSADWKNIYIDSLNSMMLLDYSDVIMFESLVEDVKRIQHVFGFSAQELCPTNNLSRPLATRNNYRSLYDRRTRAIITRLSRQVIDRFNYTF